MSITDELRKMAPTSDERREVAEALRGLRHMTYYSEEVVENIKDAIGIADPVNTFREPEDVYELLADLIDPTCHLLPSSDGGYGCDRCYTWFPSMKEKTNYCPECGARVVRDDD